MGDPKEKQIRQYYIEQGYEGQALDDAVKDAIEYQAKQTKQPEPKKQTVEPPVAKGGNKKVVEFTDADFEKQAAQKIPELVNGDLPDIKERELFYTQGLQKKGFKGEELQKRLDFALNRDRDRYKQKVEAANKQIQDSQPKPVANKGGWGDETDDWAITSLAKNAWNNALIPLINNLGSIPEVATNFIKTGYNLEREIAKGAEGSNMRYEGPPGIAALRLINDGIEKALPYVKPFTDVWEKGVAFIGKGWNDVFTPLTKNFEFKINPDAMNPFIKPSKGYTEETFSILDMDSWEVDSFGKWAGSIGQGIGSTGSIFLAAGAAKLFSKGKVSPALASFMAGSLTETNGIMQNLMENHDMSREEAMAIAAFAGPIIGTVDVLFGVENIAAKGFFREIVEDEILKTLKGYAGKKLVASQFKEIGTSIGRGVTKRMTPKLLNSAIQMGVEGVTEGAQSGIEKGIYQLVDNYLGYEKKTGEKLFDKVMSGDSLTGFELNAKAYVDMINEAAIGGIASGPFTAIHMMTSPSEQQTLFNYIESQVRSGKDPRGRLAGLIDDKRSELDDTEKAYARENVQEMYNVAEAFKGVKGTSDAKFQMYSLAKEKVHLQSKINEFQAKEQELASRISELEDLVNNPPVPPTVEEVATYQAQNAAAVAELAQRQAEYEHHVSNADNVNLYSENIALIDGTAKNVAKTGTVDITYETNKKSLEEKYKKTNPKPADSTAAPAEEKPKKKSQPAWKANRSEGYMRGRIVRWGEGIGKQHIKDDDGDWFVLNRTPGSSKVSYKPVNDAATIKNLNDIFDEEAPSPVETPTTETVEPIVTLPTGTKESPVSPTVEPIVTPPPAPATKYKKIKDVVLTEGETHAITFLDEEGESTDKSITVKQKFGNQYVVEDETGKEFLVQANDLQNDIFEQDQSGASADFGAKYTPTNKRPATGKKDEAMPSEVTQEEEPPAPKEETKSPAADTTKEDEVRARIAEKKARLKKLNDERNAPKIMDDPKRNAEMDIEMLSVATEMIGDYIELGKIKFKDIINDIIAEDGRNFAEQIFNYLKKAYAAYYQEAADDVADKMDDAKTVRGSKFEDFAEQEAKPTETTPEGSGVGGDVVYLRNKNYNNSTTKRKLPYKGVAAFAVNKADVEAFKKYAEEKEGVSKDSWEEVNPNGMNVNSMNMGETNDYVMDWTDKKPSLLPFSEDHIVKIGINGDAKYTHEILLTKDQSLPTQEVKGETEETNSSEDGVSVDEKLPKILNEKQRGSLFKGETWKYLADKVSDYFLPKFNKPLVLESRGDILSDNFTKTYGDADIQQFVDDYTKYPNATVKIKAEGNSVSFPKEVSDYLHKKLEQSLSTTKPKTEKQKTEKSAIPKVGEKTEEGEYAYNPSFHEAVDNNTGDVIVGKREYNMPLADGDTIQYTHVLADAALILPSHDPRGHVGIGTAGTGDNGNLNVSSLDPTDGYPERDGKSANSREYNTKSVIEAMFEHAYDLIAEYLLGSKTAAEGEPIITDDGVVISGNSRMMSLWVAIERNKDKKTKVKLKGNLRGVDGNYDRYLAALKKEIEESPAKYEGITVEQIDEMVARGKHPVLVKKTSNIKEYSKTEFDRYNQTLTQSKTEEERAKTTKDAIDSATIEQKNKLSELFYMVDDSGVASSIKDILSSKSKAQKIADLLSEMGLLSKADYAKYLHNGIFNTAGIEHVTSLLRGIILTDETLELFLNSKVDDEFGLKHFVKNIERALPALLYNYLIDGDANIVDWLIAAVQLKTYHYNQGVADNYISVPRKRGIEQKDNIDGFIDMRIRQSESFPTGDDNDVFFNLMKNEANRLFVTAFFAAAGAGTRAFASTDLTKLVQSFNNEYRRGVGEKILEETVNIFSDTEEDIVRKEALDAIETLVATYYPQLLLSKIADPNTPETEKEGLKRQAEIHNKKTVSNIYDNLIKQGLSIDSLEKFARDTFGGKGGVRPTEPVSTKEQKDNKGQEKTDRGNTSDTDAGVNQSDIKNKDTESTESDQADINQGREPKSGTGTGEKADTGTDSTKQAGTGTKTGATENQEKSAEIDKKIESKIDAIKDILGDIINPNKIGIYNDPKLDAEQNIKLGKLVTELVPLYIQKGYYAFKDMFLSVYNTYGEQIARILHPFLADSYMGYQTQIDDDAILDKMQSAREIKKETADKLISEVNNADKIDEQTTPPIHRIQEEKAIADNKKARAYNGDKLNDVLYSFEEEARVASANNEAASNEKLKSKTSIGVVEVSFDKAKDRLSYKKEDGTPLTPNEVETFFVEIVQGKSSLQDGSGTTVFAPKETISNNEAQAQYRAEVREALKKDKGVSKDIADDTISVESVYKMADKAGVMPADFHKNIKQAILDKTGYTAETYSEILKKPTNGQKEKTDKSKQKLQDESKPSSGGTVRGNTSRGVHPERPPIVYAAKSQIPSVEKQIKDSEYTYLDEHQRFGVNLILSRFFNKGRGFFLADGPGVGKTAVLLAVAHVMSKKGKVLIVTQSKDIINDSFKDDAIGLGIDPKKSGITITTYNDIKALDKDGNMKYSNTEFELVIYDEAHKLKNSHTATAIASFNIKSNHVLFSSATPMDKATGAVYFMSQILGLSEDEIYNRIGLQVSSYRDKDGVSKRKVTLLKGTSPQQVAKKLQILALSAVREGAMLRREFPFWGTIEEVALIPNNIVEILQEEAEIRTYWESRPRTAGQMYNELRRWNESKKVEAIWQVVMEELEAGRKVVVFANFYTQSLIKALGKEVPMFITLFTEKAESMGIPIAKLWSAHDVTVEREKFQNGEVSIALGTFGSAATGVQADDRVGDAPRTLILVTPPYAGDLMQQAVGRVSRKLSQSPAKAIIVYMPGTSDSHAMGIMKKKIMTLEAMQKAGAELEALAVTDDFLNEIEGVEAEVGSTELIRDAPKTNDLNTKQLDADNFIVYGTGTYHNRHAIKSLGGRYNGFHKAWIFPLSERARVERELGIREEAKFQIAPERGKSYSPVSISGRGKPSEVEDMAKRKAKEKNTVEGMKPEEREKYMIKRKAKVLKMAAFLNKVFPKIKLRIASKAEFYAKFKKAIDEGRVKLDSIGGVKEGDEVWINIDAIVTNELTAVHEFAHVFTAIMKEYMNKTYLQGLELVRGTVYHQYAISTHSGVYKTEEDFLEEALVLAIEDMGSQILSRTLYRKFVQWARNILNRIGRRIGFVKGLSLADMSLNDFTRLIAERMLSGSEISLKEDVSDEIYAQMQIFGEPIEAPDIVVKKRWGILSNPRFSYIGAGNIFSNKSKDVIKNAYKMALAMAAKGKTSEEIRLATGWFRNPFDKKWRYEIGDREMSFKNDETSLLKISNATEASPVKLSDVIKHDKLFALFPELKDIVIAYKQGDTDYHASMSGDGNRITVALPFFSVTNGQQLAILLHEIQHGIQIREGLAMGASPEQMTDILANLVGARAKAMQPLLRHTEYPLAFIRIGEYYNALKEILGNKEMEAIFEKTYRTTVQAEINSIEDTINGYDSAGIVDYQGRSAREYLGKSGRFYSLETSRAAKTRLQYADAFIDNENLNRKYRAVSTGAPLSSIREMYYMATAGEIEARDVEARMFMTEEERMETPPYSTEDYEADEAITYFGTEEDVDFAEDLVGFRPQIIPALKDVESTAKALEEINEVSYKPLADIGEKLYQPKYVDESTARDVIESFTHYKSGNNKYPATKWARWFQSVDANAKKDIVDDIKNNPELRNSMLSLLYDLYKKEIGFDGSFEDFILTPIKLFRGVTDADKKGKGQEGFSAYSISKNRVSVYAHNRSSNNPEVKEVTIRPIDTYGAVNYIMGTEIEVLLPQNLSKETLQKEFNRLVELNIGKFSEKQHEKLEEYYTNDDYIGGVQYAKSVINGSHKIISEAYHKAKADGSNTELVKAVEDLLGSKEPKFSIIGETGAARMQNATAILDDLSVAKDMTNAGKDAKTIRLATGWEKGVDGKWRYEVPDMQPKIDFDEIGGIADRALSVKEGVNLEQIMEAPELFKAYPQLKWIKVGYNRRMESAASWDYLKGDGFGQILVNPEISIDIHASIVHEVQHAIQMYEGFAKGGSRKTFTTEQLFKKAQELKLLGKGLTDEQIRFNVYLALAGEVEARNAEARMKMPPEERRKTLLQETEDVAREQQIVLMDALGGQENARFFSITPSDIATIKANAQANGTFMKAPNGKPTKLTENQWLQVRTPEFKAWFGDWENDPKNASKVVDENGEPLVLMHGPRTTKVFNDFKGKAIFFTDDENTANLFFNEAKYRMIIDGKHYMDLSYDEADEIKDLIEPYESVEWIENWNLAEIWAESPNLKKYLKSQLEITKRPSSLILEPNKNDIFEVFLNIRNPKIKDYKGKTWGETDAIIEKDLDYRHDGFIAKNIVEGGLGAEGFGVSNTYVAFEPNQIKSATDNIGTFSPDTNDIRFSITPSTTPAGTSTARFYIPNGMEISDYLGRQERNAYHGALSTMNHASIIAQMRTDLDVFVQAYITNNIGTAKRRAMLTNFYDDAIMLEVAQTITDPLFTPSKEAGQLYSFIFRSDTDKPSQNLFGAINHFRLNENYSFLGVHEKINHAADVTDVATQQETLNRAKSGVTRFILNRKKYLIAGQRIGKNIQQRMIDLFNFTTVSKWFSTATGTLAKFDQLIKDRNLIAGKLKARNNQLFELALDEFSRYTSYRGVNNYTSVKKIEVLNARDGKIYKMPVDYVISLIQMHESFVDHWARQGKNKTSPLIDSPSSGETDGFVFQDFDDPTIQRILRVDDAEYIRLQDEINNTPEYSAMYHRVEGLFNRNDIFDYLSQTYSHNTGLKLPRVAKYFPLTAITDTNAEMELRNITGLLEETSIIKPRTGPAKQYRLMGAMSAMKAHYETVEDFVQNQEVILNISNYLNKNETVLKADKYNQPELIEYLNNFMKDLNNWRRQVYEQNKDQQNTINIPKLLSKFALSRFAWNFGMPLIQAFGYFPALMQGVIKDKYLILAGKDLSYLIARAYTDSVLLAGEKEKLPIVPISTGEAKLMDEIRHNVFASELYLRLHQTNPDVDLTPLTEINPRSASTVAGAAMQTWNWLINTVADKYGMSFMRRGDRAPILTFYKAAQYQFDAESTGGILDGMNRDEWVADKATKLMYATNQLYPINQRTGFQRRKDIISKMIGLFSGQQQKQLNLALQSYADYLVSPTTENKWRLTGAIGFGIIFSAFGTAFVHALAKGLRDSIKPKDDDDDDEKQGELLFDYFRTDLIRNLSGNIPGLPTEIFNTIVSYLDQQYWTDKPVDIPPITAITESALGFAEVMAGLSMGNDGSVKSEYMQKKTIHNGLLMINRNVSQLIGFPFEFARQIENTVLYSIKPEKPRAKSKKAF